MTTTTTSTAIDTGKSVITGSPQYGWVCPLCGAVMSPLTTTCVNNHSNMYFPYWWERPYWWEGPYYYQTTCGNTSAASKPNT